MVTIAWINLIWNGIMIVLFTVGHYSFKGKLGKHIYFIACSGPALAVLTSLFYLYGPKTH